MKPLLVVWFAALTCFDVSAQAASLPQGFDTIRLGMTLDQVKTALGKSGYFVYRGDSDVTLLSKPNSSLVDVSGITYLTRGIFQLIDDKLYSITLEFDRSHFDYFTLYTKLAKKYGNPQSLDPSIARWEDKTVRLSLEKPLSLKYIDVQVHQKLQKDDRTKEAIEKITREKFLEEL